MLNLKTPVYILIVCCLLLTTTSLFGEESGPKLAKQRIVFSTVYGDLVFALYPEVAPLHVAQMLNLTKLGIFDSGQVMRVIPNFIIQFSDRYRRLKPLSKEQADAIKPIKAEFSDELFHFKGILSMARYDNDPDSATMSFSIMLGNAPHLDGKYTIFGRLESGGSVVDRILTIPLNGEQLSNRVVINRAYIVDDIEAYYQKHPKDPVENMGMVQSTQLAKKDKPKPTVSQTKMLHLVAILLGAIIMVSLFGVLLSKHISHNRLISLLLVNVLIGGFGLFMLLTPETGNSSWLGIVIFMGIFGMLRLMSRFEKSS